MLGKIFRVLEGAALLGLAFVFLRWYVKGHFGKHFIWFWLNTALSFIIYFNNKNQIEQEYDHRTGAEIWNEMHR